MADSESRRRLLAAAKALVLANGYAGTTVDAICEKAGLTKGSFYYFFKSKEDLGVAVLEWSLQTGGEVLADGPHTEIEDPVEKAFAYLEHIEACAPQLWSGGCLLGSFALELAETNDRLQKTVSRLFHDVARNFAQVLRPVVEQCPPGTVPSATVLAEQLLGTLEGSIILAKAHRDWTRIPKAVRAFRTSLQSLIAQSA